MVIKIYFHNSDLINKNVGVSNLKWESVGACEMRECWCLWVVTVAHSSFLLFSGWNTETVHPHPHKFFSPLSYEESLFSHINTQSEWSGIVISAVSHTSTSKLTRAHLSPLSLIFRIQNCWIYSAVFRFPLFFF